MRNWCLATIFCTGSGGRAAPTVSISFHSPASLFRLPTTRIHVDETNTIRDKRVFGGQYAELDWRPLPEFDVLGGLRLNETFEDKASGHFDGFDPADDEFGARKAEYHAALGNPRRELSCLERRSE